MTTKNKKKTTEAVADNIIAKESKAVLTKAKEKAPVVKEIKDDSIKALKNDPTNELFIPEKNRVKHQHNPIHWKAKNDLIVKLDDQIKYVGSTTKVGQMMPRKDADSTVYETVEEKSVLTSNVRAGRIFSVPDSLSLKYSFGDYIVFDIRSAKVIDYSSGYALVPAHSVIGEIEDFIVVDGNFGAKEIKSNEKKPRVRRNFIGWILQGFRRGMGRTDVSKR